MTLLVGYVTRKIFSKVTYNVSSGTLKLYYTIPYYCLFILMSWFSLYSHQVFG